MSSFHVLVIGAGLGGLALASGLSRRGIRCTVFERDETPRDRLQGYRIVLRNEPNSNVYAMDALRDLLPEHLQNKLFSMTGDGGSTATALDENLVLKNVFKLPGDSVSIGRMALRDVILDGLDTGVVQFDKKFVSYERRGDKIIVKFEDGQEVEGDFLVAPDVATHLCLGSSGQGPVTPGSEAERLIQRTALRDGMITVNKPGRVFYASRHILRPDQERFDEDFLWSNHRSYIYWVLNTSLANVHSIVQDQSPHKLSGDQLLCHACDLVREFHPNIDILIRQSDPATAVWLDFNSGEAIEWVTDSQISFIGDSIHGMTPFLGSGALLAIVDGWQLSNALATAVNDKMDLIDAVRQYEKEMRERSFPLMQRSVQRMMNFTDPSAVTKGK